MSILQSIKEYCIWCSNNKKEVGNCVSYKCPLFLLRFGKGADNIDPLKSIRENCKLCYNKWRTCDDKECSLNPYKRGTDPKIKR